MSDQNKQSFLNQFGADYQYGFSDPDIASFRAEKGLTRDIVRQISAFKEEPEWMLNLRLKSLNTIKRPMRMGFRYQRFRFKQYILLCTST